MIRLFAALELPPVVARSLDRARGSVEGARWQRDDQLHLTLAFFGELDGRVASDLVDQLAEVRFAPFDMALRGVDQFGKDGRVKTLWTGVDNPAPVSRLHEKIVQCAWRAGARSDERRFKPHVTLARFRRGACPPIGSWLHDNENLVSPTFTVQHFTLFSSHATDEGSYYRAEARYGIVPDWVPDVGSDCYDDPLGMVPALWLDDAFSAPG